MRHHLKHLSCRFFIRGEPPNKNAVMLVHFRQRLEIDLVNKINIKMCEEGRGEVETEKKSSRAVKKKRV
jgi:actin-related protein